MLRKQELGLRYKAMLNNYCPLQAKFLLYLLQLVQISNYSTIKLTQNITLTDIKICDYDNYFYMWHAKGRVKTGGQKL